MRPTVPQPGYGELAPDPAGRPRPEPEQLAPVSLGNMLRLLDTSTGSYAEVRSARRGLLRVCAHVPAAAGGADLTGLRILLVADLLARTAELGDLQVQTVLAAEGDPAAVEQAADALNIHPPVAQAGLSGPAASLGGPIDVHLASHDVVGQGGLAVRVGASSLPEADGTGRDPLAVRLALLSLPYDKPADLAEGTLAEASQTLGQWRRQVADWAQSPSLPMPPPVADQVRAACDDLDTASLLALLRDLAPDDGVPPGAKFETFAFADRILGLDLVRDVGRAG